MGDLNIKRIGLKPALVATKQQNPAIEPKASIFENNDSRQPFFYGNENKIAQTEKEKRINSFLTTKGFVGIMKYYYSGEDPERSGYAKDVPLSLFYKFDKLNGIITDRNNRIEFLNMVQRHTRTQNPQLFAEGAEVINMLEFQPDSVDGKYYLGSSIEDYEAHMQRANDAFVEFGKKFNLDKNSYGIKCNENGNFTSMFVVLDGVRYSIEQEYYEDSAYPSFRREITTNPDGTQKITETYYNYDERGIIASIQSDLDGDKSIDTVINYNENQEITSFQNIPDCYLDSLSLNSDLLESAMRFSGDEDGFISLDEEGNLTIDTTINSVDISITLDSQGYITNDSLIEYLNITKGSSGWMEILNANEGNVKFKLTDEGLEKKYLDGETVVYDINGRVIKGQDRLVTDKKIDINEQIDDYSQGNSGDCWLLSGLSAFNSSETGRKIIKKAIGKKFFKDVYTVKLGGKNYTVSERELQVAKSQAKYSFGDDDVLIMELAFEQYRKDALLGNVEDPTLNYERLGQEKDVLNGGTFSQMTYALTGKTAQNVNRDSYDYNDNFSVAFDAKKQYPDDYAIVVYFSPENENSTLTAVNSSGKEIVVANQINHGWAVQSVQNGYVTLVNPWDTNIKEVFSLDEIKAKSTSFGFFDF